MLLGGGRHLFLRANYIYVHIVIGVLLVIGVVFGFESLSNLSL